MGGLDFISTNAAPAVIGPYSQATAFGETLYCSGQIALDPATGLLVGADVRTQTQRALANLGAVLSAAGSDAHMVIRTTVYLVDLRRFDEMNEVYAKFFGDHRPARVTVGVAALPVGALVEIDCVAAVNVRR